MFCQTKRNAPVSDTARIVFRVRWNERYRSGDFPTEPHPLVVQAASMLPPGRALDLACGAGRNARYLRDRGWSVLAIDNSDAALEIVRAMNIDTRKVDLEREPLPFDDESFDLVCIINFLHRPLFAEAKRVTRPNGIVAAAICPTGKYSLTAEELRACFAEWTIVGNLIAIK